MKTRFDLDQEGAQGTNSVRAVVATVCVLGLASFMWLHSGGAGGFNDESAQSPTPAAMASTAPNPGSLHAPTSDPSLPSLEATFSRKDFSAADDPPAPTF
jgi:hypothetical protein